MATSWIPDSSAPSAHPQGLISLKRYLSVFFVPLSSTRFFRIVAPSFPQSAQTFGSIELTGTDGLSALHGLHGHDGGEERLRTGGFLGLGGGRLGAKAAGLAAGVLGAADGADGAEGGGNSEEAEGQDALADHHLALIVSTGKSKQNSAPWWHLPGGAGERRGEEPLLGLATSLSVDVIMTVEKI